jgi:uncharacterized protein YccT (UPF0319 family)
VAQVQQETVVITVSKLVKDGADAATLISDEVITALESVAEELVGAGVVVEAAKA